MSDHTQDNTMQCTIHGEVPYPHDCDGGKAHTTNTANMPKQPTPTQDRAVSSTEQSVSGDAYSDPANPVDEIDYILRDFIDAHSKAFYDPKSTPKTAVEIRSRAKAAIQSYATAAFEHGRKVGQYQAADKMYGDVCHIYMFGDNPTSAKAKSISEWSAVGLLQDCEAFMNDNSEAYTKYLAQLSHDQKGQKDV